MFIWMGHQIYFDGSKAVELDMLHLYMAHNFQTKNGLNSRWAGVDVPLSFLEGGGH